MVEEIKNDTIQKSKIDINRILVRNESFGGILFNQQTGTTIMIDSEGFKTLVKAVYKKSLSKEETTFLRNLIPDPIYKEIKILFDPSIKIIEDPPLITSSPILIDLSLNNQCNEQCSFCYMSSKPNGHGESIAMEDINILIKMMKHARVFQIALGGGEPTLHPEFPKILKKLRLEADVIPNYTTNGSTLNREILLASKKYCGAVAVSYNKHRFNETLIAAEKLRKASIKTNVHIVLLRENFSQILNIIQEYAKIGISGVVLLLFKPMGRGSTLRNQIIRPEDENNLAKELIKITAFCQSKKITLHYDACSAPLIRKLPYLAESIDGCNGARYSCYVDLNLRAKPCSFMQNKQGIDLHSIGLKKAWNSPFFLEFRRTLLRRRFVGCKKCDYFTSCWGGCPIIPEIAICSDK